MGRDQRRHLLTRLENLAAAHHVEVVVVFDGADVVGAHADARRRLRVVYSPAGVTADAVIRDLAGSVDTARPVVVVTDDVDEVVQIVERHWSLRKRKRGAGERETP